MEGLEKESKCEHVEREGEMSGSHRWNIEERTDGLSHG